MARTGIDDGDVVDDDDQVVNLIDEFVKMKALAKLDISHNKLSKVPTIVSFPGNFSEFSQKIQLDWCLYICLIFYNSSL